MDIRMGEGATAIQLDFVSCALQWKACGAQRHPGGTIHCK